MGNPDLLTVREVSDLLRVHIRTVQRLSKQGKIRAIKVGSQWRYKRTDIEQYYNLGTDYPECRACPRFNTNFIRLTTFIVIISFTLSKHFIGGIYTLSA